MSTMTQTFESARILSPRRKSTQAHDIDSLALEQLHHFGIDPESQYGKAMEDAARHLYEAKADVARLWEITNETIQELPQEDRMAYFNAKKFLCFQLAKILDSLMNPFRKTYQSMPDADMDAALEACVSGAYWAAGQNCVHVQRILIHEQCYADFSKRFVARVKEIRTGSKTDPNTQMGPMIHMDAVATIMTKLESAQATGARILCGGNHQGTVMEPTVVEAIDPKHPLAYDEVFGPVTSLFSFKTEDEAIQLANTSPYGLHAGIFTSDLRTAFSMADAIDCGGVMINESSDYRIDAMPFGGTKGSGLGREGLRFAMEAMSEPKVYCFNF